MRSKPMAAKRSASRPANWRNAPGWGSGQLKNMQIAGRLRRDPDENRGTALVVWLTPKIRDGTPVPTEKTAPMPVPKLAPASRAGAPVSAAKGHKSAPARGAGSRIFAPAARSNETSSMTEPDQSGASAALTTDAAAKTPAPASAPAERLPPRHKPVRRPHLRNPRPRRRSPRKSACGRPFRSASPRKKLSRPISAVRRNWCQTGTWHSPI